jgi:dihydropteroate synthase
MGIVNMTPDSFSDGGRHANAPAAIGHALELVRQGADIIDIGGESTRPGATPVSLDEELVRVVPVVEGILSRISVPLSIDTSKAPVALECLQRGAHIVNDVTALNGDVAMPEVVGRFQAGVILMHMQGTPATMQVQPHYEDVVAEIAIFFQNRLHALAGMGIAADWVVLDPGIGFGKTTEHNLEILARLEEFRSLGRPVCLGVSRKGFFGRLLNNRPVEHRLAGSLAAVGFVLSRQAVHVIRVHDVEATKDALMVFAALNDRRSGRETTSRTC